MAEASAPPDPPPATPGRLAVSALVALVAAAAYAATLGYDLVWDDTLLIQQSWRLHHWHALPSMLTSHFWSEVGEVSHYYRPLITLTFFLDLQIWGLHPLGFHLTNVLAHAAVTLAVLAVARRTLDGEPAAAICALAFALHPLHTESVSFVSGRTDVIATLFFLLALLAYERGRARERWGSIAWSLAAYLLALLAKEVAIALPVVLMLWDRLVRGDLRDRGAAWRAAPRYAAYGAVTALYLGLRLFALGGPEPGGAAWGPVLTRALTTLRIVASYTWLTIVPYPTSPYYAIAPEMFARQGDVSGMSGINEIMTKIVPRVPDAQVMADLDAALAFAASSGHVDPERASAVGFCWGGPRSMAVCGPQSEIEGGRCVLRPVEGHDKRHQAQGSARRGGFPHRARARAVRWPGHLHQGGCRRANARRVGEGLVGLRHHRVPRCQSRLQRRLPAGLRQDRGRLCVEAGARVAARSRRLRAPAGALPGRRPPRPQRMSIRIDGLELSDGNRKGARTSNAVRVSTVKRMCRRRYRAKKLVSVRRPQVGRKFRRFGLTPPDRTGFFKFPSQPAWMKVSFPYYDLPKIAEPFVEN